MDSLKEMKAQLKAKSDADPLGFRKVAAWDSLSSSEDLAGLRRRLSADDIQRFLAVVVPAVVGAWQPASTAPKDGSHILVAFGPYYSGWEFNQRPPAVVHYWDNPGEEGFYLSRGDQENSVTFTEWLPLVGTEPLPLLNQGPTFKAGGAEMIGEPE